MRKCMILLCLMCNLWCMAQEHMKFMEISMGQNIEAFSDALKRKGFNLLPKSKNAPKGQRFFSGKFAGEEVELKIDYDIVAKDVIGVIVDFGWGMSDSKLEQLYGSVLKSLMVKCSDFEMITEDSPTTVTFKSPKGAVFLYFKQDSMEKLKMVLNYCDLINMKKERDRKLSAVLNDV